MTATTAITPTSARFTERRSSPATEPRPVSPRAAQRGNQEHDQREARPPARLADERDERDRDQREEGALAEPGERRRLPLPHVRQDVLAAQQLDREDQQARSDRVERAEQRPPDGPLEGSPL